MKNVAFVAFVALAAAGQHVAAQSASVRLTVDIEGAEASEKGEIVCRLFDEEHWLDEELARKSTAPTKPSVEFSIGPGRYAVACFHDSDGNGKLTFGWFWRPKEGSGFSNGYRPMGPPRFKKAAFDVKADTAVVVPLEYP